MLNSHLYVRTDMHEHFQFSWGQTHTHILLSFLCGGCMLGSNLLLRNCAFGVHGMLSKRPAGYLPLILQHSLCLIMQGDRRPARPLIREYSSWYRPSVPVFLRSAPVSPSRAVSLWPIMSLQGAGMLMSPSYGRFAHAMRFHQHILTES